MPPDERAHGPQPLATRGQLETESITLIGRIVSSSNGAHLVELAPSGRSAIYKPDVLERPLWDFPPGLWRRELAFAELAQALGTTLVPPVVYRADLPLGPGSLQAFVDARFEVTYFDLLELPRFHEKLVVLAALDVVANNADRKGSHVLLDKAEQLWAIDNALTFHPEPKLRTVIWDFEGHELPPDLLERLKALVDAVPEALEYLLVPEELVALRRRARRLVREGVLPPLPASGRPYPWPPL